MAFHIMFKLNTSTMPSINSCFIELYIEAGTLEKAIARGKEAAINGILGVHVKDGIELITAERL